MSLFLLPFFLTIILQYPLDELPGLRDFSFHGVHWTSIVKFVITLVVLNILARSDSSNDSFIEARPPSMIQQWMKLDITGAGIVLPLEISLSFP
jgi:hypothetical protein